MSEKLDKLFKELKDGHMVSLYRERVMFFNEGTSEIQFWKLREDESNLTLFNSGVEISFDSYNINKDENGVFLSMDLILKENQIAHFIFPSEKKIIANHNTFYVEEFALQMEDVLKASDKGDWANRTEQLKYLTDGIKNNLEKTKTTHPKEEITKSCIDIANYAMMIRYLYGE